MGVKRPGGEIPIISVTIRVAVVASSPTHPRSTEREVHWHTRTASSDGPARPFLPRWVMCPSGLSADVGEWSRAWVNEDPGVPVPGVQKGLRIGRSGSPPGPPFQTKRGKAVARCRSSPSAAPPLPPPPLPGRPQRGPFKRPARLRQPPRPPPPGPPLPAARSAGRAGVRPERAGRSAAPRETAAAGTRAAPEQEESARAAAMG